MLTYTYPISKLISLYRSYVHIYGISFLFILKVLWLVKFYCVIEFGVLKVSG